MLDDLTPVLGEKGRDLVQRLNNKKDVTQALPAEMELALLWAIASLGDIDVEPEWWADRKRPDAVSDCLVPRRSVAVEIASPNDNSISGEEAMDAIALQISSAADRGKRGSGAHLYFRFSEESQYLAGRYTRKRLAPGGFKLSEADAAKIATWVSSGRSLSAPLRLTGPGLDVEVEHTSHRQTRYHNLFSTMPPETHSLEDNPLFELLVRKLSQLKAASADTLRMIFLADVGLLVALPSANARYFAGEPLFGEAVENAFPDVSYDIAEAGKCRAFGRWTATVMHLMRVLEAGLAALGRHVGVEPADSCLNQFIDGIREGILRKLLQKPFVELNAGLGGPPLLIPKLSIGKTTSDFGQFNTTIRSHVRTHAPIPRSMVEIKVLRV